MRSDDFFRMLTISERLRFAYDRVLTGPVPEGMGAYSKAARDDRFYVGTGNVSSLTQLSSYVRPPGQTRMAGREVLPGSLMAFDLRPFQERGGLPAGIADALTSPSRDADMILYRFSLPASRGAKRIIGYSLTDRHHRLVESAFTGKPGDDLLAFRDMTNRVSWQDEGADPLPDLGEVFRAFNGRDEVAFRFIQSHGLIAVRKTEPTPSGGAYGYENDGLLHLVSVGEEHLGNSISAPEITELAGMLAARRLCGLPVLGDEPKNGVRAALTVAVLMFDDETRTGLGPEAAEALSTAERAVLEQDDTEYRALTEQDDNGAANALLRVLGPVAESLPQRVRAGLESLGSEALEAQDSPAP